MKAQLGKQTGLALALLATLLATFLAMGVFTVAQANQHSAERSFSATTVAPGAEITVTIALRGEYGRGGSVSETLPEGFSLVSDSVQVTGSGFDNSEGNMVNVILARAGVTSVVYKVTAPAEAGGPHAFTGNFVDFASESVAISGVAGADMITVEAATNGENGDGTDEVNLATTRTTPGSNQSLKVRGMVEYGATDNITVNLKDFGVPSSIDPAHVLVTQDGSANPTDVEVDGTKVTLIAPFDPAGATPANLSGAVTDVTTIDFRRAAGITLPIRHKVYDIKVSTVETTEEDGDGFVNKVSVEREITVSPTSGTRGTEVTISGKGFTDGTAEVMFSGTTYNVDVEVDGGTFSIPVDTAVKDNDSANVFSGDPADERKTTITISDSDEKGAPEKTFEIKPSFSFSPESPTPGQDVTINLVDISGKPTSVTFTGASAIMGDDISDSDDNSETQTGWKVQVPGGTRIGNVRVTIVHPGADDPLTETVTVGTNDLTVTPETVVPRQIISIDGDGFTARGTVDLSEVTVDGEQVRTESGETEAINNNGNISFDITVPETVSSGPATVRVVGSGERIGTASITIATAEITVSPAESLRGSTITVSGTGFPANDLVLIKYNTATVDTASTSPTGTFEQDFTVPATENINPGGKYKVEAVSQVNEDAVSDTEEHKVSDPMIVISPDTAAAGSNVTITGSNFKGFLRVSSIEIGGQDVTPVPAPSTDRWGAFSAVDIQVPQLNATRHAVKVVVGRADGSDGDATEFLTVGVAVEEASTAPADVFGGLGDRLVRVWFLDRATQQWSFYDPDPDVAAFNTLTEVSGGQIVTIILSEGDSVEFQDGTLFAGSNPVSLN